MMQAINSQINKVLSVGIEHFEHRDIYNSARLKSNVFRAAVKELTPADVPTLLALAAEKMKNAPSKDFQSDLADLVVGVAHHYPHDQNDIFAPAFKTILEVAQSEDDQSANNLHEAAKRMIISGSYPDNCSSNLNAETTALVAQEILNTLRKTRKDQSGQAALLEEFVENCYFEDGVITFNGYEQFEMGAAMREDIQSLEQQYRQNTQYSGMANHMIVTNLARLNA